MVDELLGGLPYWAGEEASRKAGMGRSPADSCYLQQKATCELLLTMDEATLGVLKQPRSTNGQFGAVLAGLAS